MAPVRYKYCLVPMCKNSTVKTPDKLFLAVPKGDIRKKWCRVMKRDKSRNVELTNTSTRHVCEDHFDLEKDVENYTRFRLQGGKLYLKKGILPHKFDCQKKIRVPAASSLRAAARQHRQIIAEALREDESIPEGDNGMVGDVEDCPVMLEKATQVNIKPKKRSKCVGASISTEEAVPTKDNSWESKLQPEEDGEMESSLSSEKVKVFSSDFIPSEQSESSDSDFEQEDDDAFQRLMRSSMIEAVKKETILCLGIPKNVNCFINYLVEKSQCPELNILITLKKLRMNFPFSYLGLIFGKSESQIARAFKKTLPLLAGILQNFIIWPSNLQILHSLPIAFRRNYRVHAIIDCFEVTIEKPQNPLHQSLTWSEYKKAHTIKFLVASTPDGTLSFVSRGYGGRTTDTEIVTDSGFLNHLAPGMSVMADRSFKNISQLLEAKNCSLIRLPSVSSSTPMTKQECVEAKQIAALRTHIKRVIGRLREFHILAPHVCLDHNLVRFSDWMVTAAAGLINLQSYTIIKY